jgi:hypothetical protein
MKHILLTVVIGLLLFISGGVTVFACPCEPVWGYVNNMPKDPYSLGAGADKQIPTKEEQAVRDKKDAEKKADDKIDEKDLRLAPK